MTADIPIGKSYIWPDWAPGPGRSGQAVSGRGGCSMRILDWRSQRDMGSLACAIACAFGLLGSVQKGHSAGSGSAVAEIRPASAELFELGRATYEKQCVVCHG